MAISINHNSPLVESEILPSEIRAATRTLHTRLNQTVIPRLLLCLPPHAASPAVYAAGIGCFAQVYYLFEDAWEAILTRKPENDHIHDALKQLKLHPLLRSAKLKADLSLLDQRLGDKNELAMTEDAELTALFDRMREAIGDKPHVIMSYVWVMYMALFNGGRWIRGKLMEAGPVFWDTQAHTESPKLGCLSFWEFDGEVGGEDIKNDLKARFNIAAAILNDTEWTDVIDESVRIFETCFKLVEWLDKQRQASTIPSESVVAESHI